MALSPSAPLEEKPKIYVTPSFPFPTFNFGSKRKRSFLYCCNSFVANLRPRYALFTESGFRGMKYIGVKKVHPPHLSVPQSEADTTLQRKSHIIFSVIS